MSYDPHRPNTYEPKHAGGIDRKMPVSPRLVGLHEKENPAK